MIRSWRLPTHFFISSNPEFQGTVLSGAEEAITDNSADVVVTSRLPSGFLGEFLLNIDFIAVASPAHPLLLLERALTIEDLVRHVQTVVRDSGTLHPRDEGWLGAERRFTVSSMDASLATILAGLAYAWLPEHMLVAHLQDGSLRRLPLIAGASRHVSLYIVPLHPQAQGPAARTAVAAFHRHAKV